MLYDKTEKGLYAPSYYNDFRCIADKCRHSCCIDWEICIDENTYEKYQQLEQIRNTITESEDGPCFALTENGRCPHLNEAGLCKIILSHGEELLSDICQNHPRFFNDIGGGRMEAGLGIVCEEACRLILESETPFSLVKTEDLDDEEIFDEPYAFDPIPLRNQIITDIEAPTASFDETRSVLKKSFQIADFLSPQKWLDRFLALETLDADWKHTLLSAKDKTAQIANPDNHNQHYKRLLTYFVYRHVSIAENEKNLRARLAFSILSVEMIRYLFEREAEQTIGQLIDLARRYSAEIEYSEDNTFELIFECERRL